MTSSRGPLHRLASIGRPYLVVLLGLTSVLSLTCAPLAIWGTRLVLNTDHYVNTVAPLAANQQVQQAIIAKVDEQIDKHLDVESYAQRLPPPLRTALTGPLANGVNGLVNKITTAFVRSDAFPPVWNTMNRSAHRVVVAVATGRPIAGGTVQTNHGRVVLDLAPVVEAVKASLVKAGIGIAEHLPVVGATLEIAELRGVARAQAVVRTLKALANWLPVIGLAALATAVLLSRHRHRTSLTLLLILALGTIVAYVLLLVARHVALGNIPSDTPTRLAATPIFNVLVRDLRWGLRLLFALYLLAALVVWISNTSSFRSAVGSILRRRQEGPGDNGRATRLSGAVRRYRNAIRVTVLALGGVAFILLDSPPLAATLTIVAIAVVLLLIVQILVRLTPASKPAGKLMPPDSPAGSDRNSI